MRINDRIRKGRGYNKQRMRSSISPEPQLDWDRLRLLKQKCEACKDYDEMVGGCRIGFMPGCTYEDQNVDMRHL